VAKGILEKQRGASMIVAYGALGRLLGERRERYFNDMVSRLVTEATKLGLSEDEVLKIVRTHFKKTEGGDNNE
jgi:DNA-binding transcriptional regulator YhcF (GntR family)